MSVYQYGFHLFIPFVATQDQSFIRVSNKIFPILTPRYIIRLRHLGTSVDPWRTVSLTITDVDGSRLAYHAHDEPAPPGYPLDPSKFLNPKQACSEALGDYDRWP